MTFIRIIKKSHENFLASAILGIQILIDCKKKVVKVRWIGGKVADWTGRIIIFLLVVCVIMIVVNPESLKASFSRIISLLLRAVPEPIPEFLGLKKRKEKSHGFFLEFWLEFQSENKKFEDLSCHTFENRIRWWKKPATKVCNV